MVNRDLKMRGQQRQVKRRLKSEFALTLSNARELSWSWIPKSLIQVKTEERKFCRCLFTRSIKHEIKHFHVVVVQWRQRNVEKGVMNVQSCCFAC